MPGQIQVSSKVTKEKAVAAAAKTHGTGKRWWRGDFLANSILGRSIVVGIGLVWMLAVVTAVSRWGLVAALDPGVMDAASTIRFPDYVSKAVPYVFFFFFCADLFVHCFACHGQQ